MSLSIQEETNRRRTFAIIAHPDAGKTTLTEKLLLYGGAIQLAGAVKARKDRKSATSDWMAMEKERGISITSAALQFEYKGYVLNLLDTPGHEDFSEDTYRTLMAADTAVMVIDAAKGVEPQTRKLFKVCRDRGIPIITFINKMDRPTKNLFSLLDEIEEVLGITAVPFVWPVGTGVDFKGVFDRSLKTIHLFEKTSGGIQKAPVQVSGINDTHLESQIDPDILKQCRDEIDLVENGIEAFEMKNFLNGKISPVFFGSAVNNFGIEIFLNHFLNLAPSPYHIPLIDGSFLDPANSSFSGFIFKVQANMNRAHRDRIAFVRICSGKFERGLTVNHDRLEKQVKLSSSFAFFGQDRNTIDEAFPGDIIGLINPGTFRIGDVLFSGKNPGLRPLPVFAPELFATISSPESASLKGFKKGIEQLSEEGILHSFTSRTIGAGSPIIGALGRLQFEVFQRRLQDEYNVNTNITMLPYSFSRWIRQDEIHLVPKSANQVTDKEGRTALLFESEWDMNYFQKNNPELKLLDAPIE
ncbi:MAG: peptide chain release factor 3 [Leptospiraceae bacterium]|nr:peptide chain release factor 3 [Leptospiraceae bacterium]MCK6381476.1 peptide chain release factor 3 [Leptospiraceae bacterium]NUM40191.1 peptide chain release factor 3 [Leptospiraceae bacterium]